MSPGLQLRGELRTLFGITSMLPDDTPQAVVACIVELGLTPSKVAMGGEAISMRPCAFESVYFHRVSLLWNLLKMIVYTPSVWCEESR